jgi:hypothetical protein
MIQGTHYNHRHPAQPMPAAEHTGLRQHLATKYGLTPAQLNVAVGAGPAGKTRRQIADMLRAWLAAL